MRYWNNALLNAAEEGDLGGVQEALAHGADLHARNHLDATPAHLAAVGGHLSVLQLLVEKGADTRAIDVGHETLLHYAVSCDRVEIVRYLIDLGVDIDAKGIDGCTALYDACSFGSVNSARLLLERGASLDIISAHEDAPTILDATLSSSRYGDLEPAHAEIALMIYEKKGWSMTLCYKEKKLLEWFEESTEAQRVIHAHLTREALSDVLVDIGEPHYPIADQPRAKGGMSL